MKVGDKFGLRLTSLVLPSARLRAVVVSHDRACPMLGGGCCSCGPVVLVVNARRDKGCPDNLANAPLMQKRPTG